jgi:hypothetical protein
MSCKYWNDPGKGNVDQDNNAVENIITKMVNGIGSIPQKAIYRETCGPSSLESCLDGLGEDQSQCGILQPSDYYTMAMNDRKIINNKFFDLPTNRYIEAYPLIIGILYPKLKSKVIAIDQDKKKTAYLLKNSLLGSDTVCIINLINPGHYISALHIDDNDVVYYNDSWKDDFFNPSPNHKRSIALSALVDNMKNGFVEISK